MRALLLTRSALLQDRLAPLLAAEGHALLCCPDVAAARRALAEAAEAAPAGPAGDARGAAPGASPAAGPVDLLLVAAARGATIAAELCADPLLAPRRALLLSPEPRDAEAAAEAGAAFLPLPPDPQAVRALLRAAARRQPLVLLCDDSPLVHRYTTPILEEAGYEVAAAFDGASGEEQALALHPDLVLTDIEMPRLDGYGLCRRIKARLPRLPVIMCSTLSEAQAIERGFDAGADDYLVKPAQADELLSRIEQLLRQRDPHLGGRERILVVDDSQAVRQLVVESLRRQGFQVLTATDGEAGLCRARAERPAMIITDYEMPRMSGFEMVHALKQDEATRDIPVMMLSARDSRRDQAQMRAVGLSAYLVKPFSVDKCVAMVERVLAEQRLRAYKAASRLYISEAAVSAAEQAARTGDRFRTRAREEVASVLFSDISGFTTLSTQKSAPEVVALLNDFFDALCPIIREEGGDIDKFIGDAIMAVFAEGPGEAHPLRAVRAALRMQEALQAWNRQTGNDLRMRVGVNSGRLVRGDIGARCVRRDYTVIGDVVNRAQRLESNAPVGGVLISEVTYEAVKGPIRCEPRPGLKLKGVGEPVTAYVALGVMPGQDGQGGPSGPGGPEADGEGARQGGPAAARAAPQHPA